MKFSEKLQRLRKEKGYSQEQLADLLEVSRQSVSKWESGTTYPEMDKLLMLCKIFNVTLDDLTNDEITDKKIKEKSKNTFNNVIYAILDMINKSVEMFKHLSKKELMKCITEMLIVIFILLIFNLPFQYINQLARDIFLNFGSKAYSITYSIWNFFTSIIYLVLFIAVFIYVYKTRYLDKFDLQKIDDNGGLEGENFEEVEKESKTIKESKPEKHSFILFDVLGTIFNFIVKICLLFMCIPIICVFFSFVFLVVIALMLLIKGIAYPGFLIALLGCALLSGLVMEIAIRFLVNAEFKFKRLFWFFVSSLTICSIGVAISTFEIAETEFINKVPETEKIVTKDFEYSMNDKLFINNEYGYYYSKNTEYVIDEALKDKVLVTVSYYEDYLSINADNSDNQIFIYTWEAPYVVKHSYNLLINNLKEKTIYNYSALSDIDIVVTTSSANIKILKDNYENYEQEKKRNRENEYLLYYNQIDKLTVTNNELQDELAEANATIAELEAKITNIENAMK